MNDICLLFTMAVHSSGISCIFDGLPQRDSPSARTPFTGRLHVLSVYRIVCFRIFRRSGFIHIYSAGTKTAEKRYGKENLMLI